MMDQKIVGLVSVLVPFVPMCMTAQQVTPPSSASEVAGIPEGTVMSKAYVEMAGKFA